MAPEIALPPREALLAATLLQLCAGDTLVSSATDAAPFRLLERWEATTTSAALTTVRVGAGQNAFLAAAALAAACQRRKSDCLVLLLVAAGTADSRWTEALTWAQTEQLPLVIACADPSVQDAFKPDPSAAKELWSWTSVQKPAAKLKFPVLTVDGEDAVAVYRVMQESVLRARSGGGPALLWAALPAGQSSQLTQTSSETPLERLTRYLRVRGISRRPPAAGAK